MEGHWIIKIYILITVKDHWYKKIPINQNKSPL